MTLRLVKLVRGALLPTTLPQAELKLYGGWENKTELTGAWLTQIIHTVRFSHLFEYVSHWLTAALTWLYAGILNFMPAITFNDPSLFFVASLVQGLSWGSVCSGDPKWFAAGDPGSAAGIESSLPHGNSPAHYRRWGRRNSNRWKRLYNKACLYGL